jgi:flagellar basal-body rod protein FlgB
MFNSIDNALSFEAKALAVRGYRQQLLASNIANADTPNYKAMDIDFAKAMRMAEGVSAGGIAMARTDAGHLDASGGNALAGVKPMYRNAIQPSIDGNTVDTNVEQAQFSENALQYMSTLQFMNHKIQSALLVLRDGK